MYSHHNGMPSSSSSLYDSGAAYLGSGAPHTTKYAAPYPLTAASSAYSNSGFFGASSRHQLQQSAACYAPQPSAHSPTSQAYYDERYQSSHPSTHRQQQLPPQYSQLHQQAQQQQAASQSQSQQQQQDDVDAAEEGSTMSAGQDGEDGTFVAVLPDMSYIFPKRNTSSHGNVPWRCYQCGQFAFGCRCAGCGAARDTAALRVFVGQLTREGAAEMANAMIQTLCGQLSSPPLHIEPHTAKSGVGKGCCWVYVSTPEDVSCIVRALHKRTFCTIHEATGEVGFRYFNAQDEFGYFDVSEQEVAAMCDEELSCLTKQARDLLHCSPVTAEVPKALAAIMLSASRTAAAAPRTAPAAPTPAAPAPVASAVAPPPLVAALTMPVPVLEEQLSHAKQHAAVVPAAPTTDSPVRSGHSSGSSARSASTTPRRYMWNPYSAAKPRVVLATSPAKKL